MFYSTATILRGSGIPVGTSPSEIKLVYTGCASKGYLHTTCFANVSGVDDLTLHSSLSLNFAYKVQGPHRLVMGKKKDQTGLTEAFQAPGTVVTADNWTVCRKLTPMR